MINLREMANAAIQPVNENISVLYRASSGYTTNAASKRTPSYETEVDLQAQVQAVTGRLLAHMEKLNIQGVLRNVRMFGNTQGLVRINAKGGDLLRFPQSPGAERNTWLVVHVLETWPDWCSVIVSLQTDPTPF